jgi:hypothetical protein
MNEQRGGGDSGLQVGLLLAAALALTMVFAMWEIGSSRLYVLGLILTSSVAATLVIIASAVVVRMYRKSDAPPVIERHFRDGTVKIIERHTLDGRAPAQNDIKLLQLPAQPQGGAFPELLRAAFQSGQRGLTGGSAPLPPPNGYYEHALGEIDPSDPDGWESGWDGDIKT